MKKRKRYYRVKTIETSTTIEVWEYLDFPVFYTEDVIDEKNTIIDNIENSKKDFDKLPTFEQYDSLKRKQKHYDEMRWHIARIIDCNFDRKTKFLTLTFKENILDVTYTNNEFSKFIKRLNYFLYKEKRQLLKYIAVWEQQKRGSIHYHVILFDFPYIRANDLKKIWSHGFIKINKIDVDSSENRGRYLSKYFSKNIDIKSHKQKAFFKSQNLILPKIKKTILKDNNIFIDNEIIYEKEYTQRVPNFTGTNDEQLFFKGKVKYTKIRKENNSDDDYF